MQKLAIGSSAKLLARLAAGSSASPANFKQVARQIAKQRSEAGMFGYIDLPKNLQKPDMANAAAVRRALVPEEADRYLARIKQILGKIDKKAAPLFSGMSDHELRGIAESDRLSYRLNQLLQKSKEKPGIASRAWWAARRHLGLRPREYGELMQHVKAIPENLPEIAVGRNLGNHLMTARLLLNPRNNTINPAAFSSAELQTIRQVAGATRRAGLFTRRMDRLGKHEERLRNASQNVGKYQRPPTFAAARGPFPVQVTPETRLKAFNLHGMRDVPEGSPLWYTRHPDVVHGYAAGRSGGAGGGSGPRQAVAITDENTLRQFGPVGPLQPHIGDDTRGLLQPPKKPLIGRNTTLGKRPDYEQVATMPNLTEWIKAHRFIAPDRHNPTRLKVYSPRALGKDFGQ